VAPRPSEGSAEKGPDTAGAENGVPHNGGESTGLSLLDTQMVSELEHNP
jgi:hypothetical protein